MMFEIRKASDLDFSETREIKTIEDMMKVAEEFLVKPDTRFKYSDIIIDFDYQTITIYDDYVE